MPKCQECGSHISKDFKKVFADEQGRIRACPNCSAQAGIAESSQNRIKRK